MGYYGLPSRYFGKAKIAPAWRRSIIPHPEPYKRFGAFSINVFCDFEIILNPDSRDSFGFYDREFSMIVGELDYVPGTLELEEKWDREWCRYFTRYHGNTWFVNLSRATRAALEFQEEFSSLSKEDLFSYTRLLPESINIGLYISPEDIYQKKIAEIGCGPGQLGKQLAYVCEEYLGLDHSRLATDIAKILSPDNCRYLALRDLREVLGFLRTRDVVLTRHFYIHQNFENALWVSRLAGDLLKGGGVLVADFYYPEGELVLDRGPVRSCRDALEEEVPSRMYYFTDSEIEEIAFSGGFKIEEVTKREDCQRQFVRMRKVFSDGVEHGGVC